MIPPQHRVLYHFPVAFSRSSARHGIHGEKNNGCQIPNPIIPITQHRLPSTIFLFRLLESSQRSACNGVILQRAAMKLQIWKLEDHSLQHMSSDQVTLVAYLVSYTSLQQSIMECHDSVRAKPDMLTCIHLGAISDHFSSKSISLRQSPTD